MATRASTFVSAHGLGVPVPSGGLHMEVYRVQGGTAGDTNVVTPQRGRYVVAALGPGSTTLGTAGTDTQVTFTQTQSAASTSVTFDAILWVAE